jgi:hypothetical protein
MQLANNKRSTLAIYAVVAGIFWLMWMIAACFGEVRRMTSGRKRSTNKGYISNGSSPRTVTHRTRDIDEEPVVTGGNTTHAPVVGTKNETYA